MSHTAMPTHVAPVTVSWAERAVSLIVWPANIKTCQQLLAHAQGACKPGL